LPKTAATIQAVVDHVRQWLSRWEIGWAAGLAIGVGAMLLSTALGLAVVLWLPRDYFVRGPVDRGLRQRHVILWLSLTVLRNILGLIVLIVGLIMAMPLVPGPGLFVSVVGLGLLDFPGKRALERRLLGERHILSSVNRIRARFGKDSLLPQERRRSVVDNQA
jgi:hypothetical protein